MESLLNGVKNDYQKPGLTSNIPSWASKITSKQAVGIILETAHPAKFGSIVKDATGRAPPVPNRLQEIMNLPDNASSMENDYESFKQWLTENL